ncbi:ABC-2 type transporter family protein [Actinidia rufa]|uniref:ABC-2 type transporter family protein n=1 Tax=Actinidia rufa TaxID=165716 RepID=A0A7J0FKS4_9ERIC|nr:ABC-2 type transporter family protein [Actinidia rufa]
MFDKVLLISEGYPVYYGKARESMDYLSSLRFVPDIAMNAAEFFLDLATGQVTDIGIPEELHVSHATADHKKVVIKNGHCANFLNLLLTMPENVWPTLVEIPNWHGSSAQRSGLHIPVCCKIYPCMRIGLMFYICIFWTSTSLFGAVYVFPFEKLYLVKERKADMYRLSVYYECSTLCDMVAHVLYPSFFMGILYFMAGFKRTVSCFFMTLSTILLMAITSQGEGEVFGAAVLSIKRAGMTASLVLMLFLLTGGYYVQV